MIHKECCIGSPSLAGTIFMYTVYKNICSIFPCVQPSNPKTTILLEAVPCTMSILHLSGILCRHPARFPYAIATSAVCLARCLGSLLDSATVRAHRVQRLFAGDRIGVWAHLELWDALAVRSVGEPCSLDRRSVRCQGSRDGRLKESSGCGCRQRGRELLSGKGTSRSDYPIDAQGLSVGIWCNVGEVMWVWVRLQ